MWRVLGFFFVVAFVAESKSEPPIIVGEEIALHELTPTENTKVVKILTDPRLFSNLMDDFNREHDNVMHNVYLDATVKETVLNELRDLGEDIDLENAKVIIKDGVTAIFGSSEEMAEEIDDDEWTNTGIVYN